MYRNPCLISCVVLCLCSLSAQNSWADPPPPTVDNIIEPVEGTTLFPNTPIYFKATVQGPPYSSSYLVKIKFETGALVTQALVVRDRFARLEHTFTPALAGLAEWYVGNYTIEVTEDGEVQGEPRAFEVVPPPDDDGDGINNDDEMMMGTDPWNPDSDYDALFDGEEVYVFATDPLNPDSDAGGVYDGEEVWIYGTDPMDSSDDFGGSMDSDGDGLTDAEEAMLGTDPMNPDTDSGGVSDGEEVITNLTNPLDPSDDFGGSGDSDGDGLSDAEEAMFGTDPMNPDTDAGGVSDGEEVITNLTNPLDPSDDSGGIGDSDSDGLTDSDESLMGTDPWNPDTDSDGLSDGDEFFWYATDPTNWDTDSGGIGDGEEVWTGSDPTDPSDDI